MWTGIFFIPNNIFPWHFQPLHPALPRPTGTHPPGCSLVQGSTTRRQAAAHRNTPLATALPLSPPPLFINIADSPALMHKTMLQNRTVGSCELHPAWPVCASSLVICWLSSALAVLCPCGQPPSVLPLRCHTGAQKKWSFVEVKTSTHHHSNWS